jgi:hypothetical protein
LRWWWSDAMVMSEFVTEIKREGKWTAADTPINASEWMSVIASERRRLENAAVTVGNRMSGGGCIPSASRWLPLYSIFLVVGTV